VLTFVISIKFMSFKLYSKLSAGW